VRLRGMWSRWSGGVTITVAVAALCAGIGVTASNAARSSAPKRADHAGDAKASARRLVGLQAALASKVKYAPARGATNVGLDLPVFVATSAGRLTAVRVASASGAPLAGTFASSRHWWQSTSQLAPGTAYRVTASVTAPSGVTARSTSTFRTVTPEAFVDATLWPGDGLTVGVAQPVVIRFNHFVNSDAARARVLQHLTVTASRPVAGGWHWFSANELHFRPKAYWPVGEKVTVTSDLDGWDAGDGRWGAGHHSVHFAIGDAHISVANLVTHRMTVTNNGGVVATYPFSGGRDMYPTMNGLHIVMDRQSVVRMISSTNGIPVDSPDGYDELVYDDVHISDGGEYVHAAPWSVSSQGRANVSHGCINLSPADAATFFAFSRVGDVVEVVGGPRAPELGDHGVMDWATDWKHWTPAVAHPAAPPRAKGKPSVPKPSPHHHAWT
jgi:lipoprotein-anchoring transpeptidase ErfK/SrfK